MCAWGLWGMLRCEGVGLNERNSVRIEGGGMELV